MSSIEDSHTLRPRKNPQRTCRTIAELLIEGSRTASQQRSSKEAPKSVQSQGEIKARGRVKKPEAYPTSPSPLPTQTKTTNASPSLSRSSKASKPTVPSQTTVCPQRTPKRPNKGRKKTQPVCEKADGLDLGANVEPARQNGCPCVVHCTSTVNSEEAPRKKAKVRGVRCSKKAVKHRTPEEMPTALHTCSTLSSNLDAPDSPSSRLSTPKASRRRPSPAFSSTPVSIRHLSAVTLDPVEIAKTQCNAIDDHQSPVKRGEHSDSAPKKKRGRPRKDRAPDIQQKKRKERNVSAAAAAKRHKMKNGSDVDPQEQSADRVRPRFQLHESELQDPDLQEPDEDLSSDLSIELSLREEPDAINHSLSLQEEDEEDDEEELPSFLQQTNDKPSSIKEGLCVWCKIRKYPFWPAMVKSVNHKSKKASIVFIDGLLFDKKRIRKGFTVSLRKLKPFDCEESHLLVALAKESLGDTITWCLNLITDYRIRIGCGSFVGSFIEYFTNDISSPVRRQYPEGASELTFPSQQLLSEEPECEGENAGELEEEEIEQPNEIHSKKVLPDRSLAARNRANKRLVEFIVEKRGVENHLKAVICGQEPSKWLEALQSCSRSVVDVYLEDEEQVDKVYRYLQKLCESADQTNTSLENTDRISFILDVLLPEAIIHAIAEVDRLSLVKAEEKYRRGPCHSNRERQEFDMMIEQQMKLKP
ncbi:PWWP domain-containing DNA repair factor 3B [Astyanax mexicanus]|uniref:PWWP domain-containing protein MUM1L1-like n=1 Tax=Astyanax mexicanus TaxID=7994 RepID=A0A3B1IY49_ASTMX|nr:PWWP domain-containing DNA repair factor 3B [Astyanax mexicanus]XP_022533710.1 PWWP domain-containing DNA repair factor 3B [Astyanax mexicanus]